MTPLFKRKDVRAWVNKQSAGVISRHNRVGLNWPAGEIPKAWAELDESLKTIKQQKICAAMTPLFKRKETDVRAWLKHQSAGVINRGDLKAVAKKRRLR